MITGKDWLLRKATSDPVLTSSLWSFTSLITMSNRTSSPSNITLNRNALLNSSVRLTRGLQNLPPPFDLSSYMPQESNSATDQIEDPHHIADSSLDTDLQDDFDTLALSTPSRGAAKHASASFTHTSNGKGKRVVNKWKARRRAGEALAEPGEDCYLLNLPNDLLHLVLARLPPRTLLKLGATCQYLYEELKDESLWRQSYANRFLWDGAARDQAGKKDVEVLVQGCLNTGRRGWKKEALSREAMVDRWVGSKAGIAVHTPPTGLIHSLSLSYPPFIPVAPRPLVVGKNHQTPVKAKSAPESPTTPATPVTSTPTPAHIDPVSSEAGPSTPSLAVTPSSESPVTKMTHRQKYEALLAATTRPPPYVLSASLAVGGVVRSDPISGKVTKGYWGPGRDANLHLRPHLDSSAEPSAVYLPTRSQTYVLWGLKTGPCVHTTIQSRHHATHGGRASSVNVHSETADAHEGEITDMSLLEDYEPEDGKLRWVTAGVDGRVKIWQLNPGTNLTRSGQRTPNVESIAGSITCLFTSKTVGTPWPNRPDAVKRRQAGSPDAVVLVRDDPYTDVVCGVTQDGDLRVWFNATQKDVKEVRIDVGAEDIEGGVATLELNVQESSEGQIASVLVHHRQSPLVTRYHIASSGFQDTTTFFSPTGSSLTAFHTSLRPTAAIVAPASVTAESTPAISPADSTSDETPSEFDFPLFGQPIGESTFGRFVVAGDQTGFVHIWAWDGDSQRRQPIRSWEAMTGKVTALDVSCGLVAVGSFDGYIKVYDPLPLPPLLLRTFHASRLTPGEQVIAASDEPDGRYYTVNRILLDNDLIVASIGRKVFAWRAGSGKGRQGGKEGQGWRKSSAGSGEGKGTSRGVVMKALHSVAAEDHAEIKALSTPRASKHEERELAAMEEMGLEDGDDALQYALMMSLEEQRDSVANEADDWAYVGSSPISADPVSAPVRAANETDVGENESDKADGMDAETREAIRQVEAFKAAEDAEMGRVLRMIQEAEQRESSGDGHGGSGFA